MNKNLFAAGGALVLVLALLAAFSLRPFIITIEGLKGSVNNFGAPNVTVSPPNVSVGQPDVNVTTGGQSGTLPVDQTFGAFTRTRAMVAQTSLVTNTTTPGIICNADGDDRIINDVEVYMYDSNGSYIAGTRGAYVTTSTNNGFATTTQPLALFHGSFRPQGGPQFFSSSTIALGNGSGSAFPQFTSSTVAARLWQTGTCVTFSLNAVASSTGYLSVSYHSATSTAQTN